MKLLVERLWKKSEYTIGRLRVNGKFFCNTLEDTDRGLTQKMSLEDIKKIKKANITAIPVGTYKVAMNIISPKYSLKPWYFINCNKGRVPRLLNVPGYEGVLIHTGNTASHTSGCILVGNNTQKGMITSSKETFLKLYKQLYAAYKAGEEITITIR